MSLVHKYRPKTLDQIVGQSTVVKTLTGAIKQNRIHSAYLFAGGRGTGKTSTARVLAKSLNCEKGVTINPCGECHSCRSIESGNSIDVFEIDAAANNGVDFARELAKGTSLVSMGGRYKVYIIDECHNLTKQASEALLKTVEEPGSKTVFIFCTTEPSKVLKTIESRCQTCNFKPVDEELIFTHLSHIMHLELLSVNDDLITAISQLSEGCVRDAVTLLDQLSLIENPTIEDLYQMIGKVPLDSVIAVLEALKTSKSINMYAALKDAFKSGVDALQLLSEISNFLRNALVAKQDNKAFKLMTCDSKTFVNAGKWSKDFSIDTLENLVIFLRQKEIDFSAAKMPKLFLEASLLEVMHLLKPTTPNTQYQQESPKQIKTEQKQSNVPPELSQPVKSASFENTWLLLSRQPCMDKLTPCISRYQYINERNHLNIFMAKKYEARKDRVFELLDQASQELNITIDSIDVIFE